MSGFILGYVRRHHLAVIALLFALAGTSYAAVSLPKNSVGSKQLRKNAVVSSKVKDGSLLKQDFKSGQLPAGPQGPQGAQGPQGPAGKDGTNGATKVVFHDSDGVAVADGDDGSDSVTCDAGEKATGGGVFVTDDSGIVNKDTAVNESDVTVDENDQPNGWEGGIHNASGADVNLVVEVICASP
jgi:hypothetical protein